MELSCSLDDLTPLSVQTPASVAEAGDVVRRAAAEGHALYPVGGGTLLGVGLPPARPGVAVSLRGLDTVIDYPARDMTVTVQAGITVAALQRLLAGENQRLPVDVPQPEKATLGGALAVNTSGPRRLGHGTLRDYVIGISTINDEGLVVKAGGRVVKNVAGYDLCKLHVGALGTLGIVTQVTLKLRPLPETRALIPLGCGAEALGPLLDRLHTSRTRPVCLDVLNPAAARTVVRACGASLPESAWVVVAGFEDSSDTLAWQVKQLLQEIPTDTVQGLEARAGSAADCLWETLANLTLWSEARLTFKANLLPGSVADFCQYAASLASDVVLYAHAGSGIVHGHWLPEAADLTLDRVGAMLKGLTERAQAAHGNVVLPRCPVEWKRKLPVWGAPRGDLWLMRQVKDKLDPRRLFNPGRFVDGI